MRKCGRRARGLGKQPCFEVGLLFKVVARSGPAGYHQRDAGILSHRRCVDETRFVRDAHCKNRSARVDENSTRDK